MQDIIGNFTGMSRFMIHSANYTPAPIVRWDLRDYYTGSFTEFMPFCRSLYCVSNFKDFSTLLPS